MYEEIHRLRYIPSGVTTHISTIKKEIIRTLKKDKSVWAYQLTIIPMEISSKLKRTIVWTTKSVERSIASYPGTKILLTGTECKYFAEIFKLIQIQPVHRLVTFDIKSLYTDVPVEEFFQIVEADAL